ncbi:TcaA NTF2-like domain-containing protein [Niallia nealsonii]|uniref:TcaA protein NTF2-like domain-containing protein n=1 Tax=Niallia nealsonii TaxID=115979 RepID=A0A2N0Z073_9BACI|nr:hypothetical protein [Niallia nealsonii]PKG22905.1 hypothetical protein CWS01_14590 [Niallia nealsonii]
MNIEGFSIKEELYSNTLGLKVYKAQDESGNPVQIRLADYSNNASGRTIDNWYEVYEQYQSTITNYKYLPQVSKITMIDDSKVYTILNYEEGDMLKNSGLITILQISQLIDAVRHLHRKKIAHGSIHAENIWLTPKGNIVLYGAGELKALSKTPNDKLSFDIKSLTEIIKTFSSVNEEIMDKLEIENPTTIEELETILLEAKEPAPQDQEKRKGSLAEKDVQVQTNREVLPPDIAYEKEKQRNDSSQEKKHDKPKGNNETSQSSAVENEQKTTEQNERRTRASSTKKTAWFKNIIVGAAAVIVLGYGINQFMGSEEEEHQTAPDEETSAVQTVAEKESTEEKEEPAKEKDVQQVNAEEELQEEQEEPAVTYTDDEVERFISKYVGASVAALNEKDFSRVDQLLDPNGKSYNEQRDYIDYIAKKNITENLLSFKATDILTVNQSSYKVTTQEEYEISYDDGSKKQKEFNSSYIINIGEDGQLVVNELLYTQELSSETIQEADAEETNEVYEDDFSDEEYDNSYLYEDNMESGNETDDTGAIESMVRLHYGSISNNDFTIAYDLFSSSRKKKMSKEGWEDGLKQNIYDEITNIQVEQTDENKGKVYIEMTSYDDNTDGTTLVQDWSGYWNLVKENGRWVLDEPNLSKVDSRVEEQ